MEKSKCPMPLEDIKERVLSTIVDLYRYDGDLLDRDANERSITHKLAEHLQRQFPGWNVDCEYNRRENEVKQLVNPYKGDKVSPADLEAKTVFPDVVVHKRGEQVNLIVIEVKKKLNSRNRRKDIQKLSSFTSDENYLYCVGLFWEIGTIESITGESITKLTVFSEGRESEEWSEEWSKELVRRLQESRHAR